MNKEVKEIIDVAEELREVGERASQAGIIGVNPGEFQIYESETFKKIAMASKQATKLELKYDPDYPYWYRASLGNLRFLHLSNRLIDWEEENEST